MPKKLTKEEFIERANKIHKGRYDYSKVEYVNCETKVCIICPKHGEFWQTPQMHTKGGGCQYCAKEKLKKHVLGVGVNDLSQATSQKTVFARNCWCFWRRMLQRCYDTKYHKMRPTYIGCYVCNEWLTFSNFKKWFDKHYIEGWCLDKDILVKGNKVYSPQTCCFVPQCINTLFIKNDASRGDLPIGVTRNKNGFLPQMSRYGAKWKGKTCRNMEDAFKSYKENKEIYIKELAEKYKDQLEPRVYEALYNYKVEITD